MICHSCHGNNLLGAIFCLNCGMSLLPKDRKRGTTAMLGASTSARSSSPLNTGATNAPPDERRFRATVLNNGRHVNVPLAAPVLIGRQDSARDFFPDLDLNNDGGYDQGVSRRHARITLLGDGAYVEDLDSANGTFINETRLQPRTPQMVKATDELRLGSLILRVEQA